MDSAIYGEVEIRADDSDDLIRMHSNRHVQASILMALRNDDKWCDVSLFGVPPSGVPKSELRPIRAQKSVLACASEHFSKLFSSKDLTDSDKSECDIETVDHEVLGMIIDFIYTDKLAVSKQNAIDVMRQIVIGSKYLLMLKLADACEKFLADNLQINAETCAALWCFAYKHSCSALMDATSSFIAKHLSEMSKNERFMGMSFANFSELLVSDAVKAANADARCVAAIEWLDYDDMRSSHMHDILKIIGLAPGLVTMDTIMKARKSHMLRKYAPDLAIELMEGACERVQQNLPVVDRIIPHASNWYLIGGENAPSMFLSYDIKERLWSNLPPLPTEFRFDGACGLKNRLIIMGGSRNGGYTTDIAEYDLKKNFWVSKQGKLRDIRMYLSVCCDGQYAYAIGGRKSGNAIDTVERYDPESHQVTYTAYMQSERESLSAVFAAKYDSIYVAGGCYGSGSLSSIEKYDISADKWTPAGDSEHARYDSGIALSGSDIYIVGGDNSDENEISNIVEIFDVHTGKTRPGPNLLENRSVCVATTINDGKVICVLGGNSRTVDCLDVREGKWSTGVIVPDMPEEANNFAFAVI